VRSVGIAQRLVHDRLRAIMVALESRQPRRPPWTLAICPSGVDYAADGEGSTEAIIVAVDPGRGLRLQPPQGSAFEAELIERLSGYDQALFDLARSLAVECADGYPNGPLFWNGMASTFIEGLLVQHTAKFKGLPRGPVGEASPRPSQGLRRYPYAISASRRRCAGQDRRSQPRFTSRVYLCDRSA